MRVHQGTLRENSQKLEKVVESHPFTHQLDVVLTASEERGRLLTLLETSFYRTRTTFSALFEGSTSSTTTALTVGSLATEDVWCLDTRGVLSLSLVKDTYERLGIGFGTRVEPTNRNFGFLVRLNLHDTSPLAVRTRESLKQWDIRRAENGEDGWDVLISSHCTAGAISPESGTRRDVKAHWQTSPDVWIPPPAMPLIKSDSAREELADLFEWVGLAGLGSQRLRVGDAVSSYAASYEPPLGSSTGKIIHLRWSGFLPPTFVHSVLKEVLVRTEGVRAISALSFDAPVSYICSSGTTLGGENLWTLILSEAQVQDTDTHWILAQSHK